MTVTVQLDLATLQLTLDAADALSAAQQMLAEATTTPTALDVVRWCEERMTGGRRELQLEERRTACAELRCAVICAALELVEVKS